MSVEKGPQSPRDSSGSQKQEAATAMPGGRPGRIQLIDRFVLLI